MDISTIFPTLEGTDTPADLVDYSQRVQLAGTPRIRTWTPSMLTTGTPPSGETSWTRHGRYLMVSPFACQVAARIQFPASPSLGTGFVTFPLPVPPLPAFGVEPHLHLLLSPRPHTVRGLARIEVGTSMIHRVSILDPTSGTHNGFENLRPDTARFGNGAWGWLAFSGTYMTQGAHT